MKRNTIKYVLGLVTIMVLIGYACSASNNPSPEKLKVSLEKLTDGFHGRVGIYVQNLNTGLTVEINADTLFPTASMIKIPIAINVFNRIEKGELSLDSTLIFFHDSINYPWKGDDAVSRFADGENISIGKLLAHSLTFSDNYASLWLQKLAGGGTTINTWLNDNGWNETRMNSRTMGREEDHEVYGWGQSTPREMAQFLIRLRKGEIISPRVSEDLYRYLCRSYWDGIALSQIPPTVQAASKQGAVDEARSEVVMVNAPHGDYVFCIMTKNQEDTSWGLDNEGFTLIRKISALLWKTFEPESSWRPAQGMEIFWE